MDIVDGKKIAINYIKSGRFFVDLGASIPLELIIEWVDPTISSS